MSLLHKPATPSELDPRLTEFLKPARPQLPETLQPDSAPPVAAIPDHVQHQLAMEASGRFASTPGYHAQRFTPLQWEHHRRLRASHAINQVPR